MRYDHIWTPDELSLARHTSKRGFALDNLGSVSTLQEVGRSATRKSMSGRNITTRLAARNN